MISPADCAPNSSAPTRVLAAGLCVVFVLVWLAFLPSLFNGFVDWDDLANLVENPHYRGLGWMQINWAFTTFWMGHYQPLTWISLGLDFELWGMNPRGYHATSLLLHALNAVLFGVVAFQVLRKALGCRTPSSSSGIVLGSLFAACVFALHPLRVESAAWVTERRDVLCGFFLLVSVICYLHAEHTGTMAHLKASWYWASVLAFGASLLSKALGMSLPLVLLLIDAYPLRRWTQVRMVRCVAEKVPFLMLSIVAGLVALAAQHEGGALVAANQHSVLQRVAQSIYGLMFYPRATFLSVSWSPLHELPSSLDPWSPPFVLSAIGLFALVVILLLLRSRWPGLMIAFLAYAVLLMPVSGIAQSGAQLVADRYSYIACLSFALVLGGVVSMWWNSAVTGVGRWACIMAALALLTTWGALTWRQTLIWRDARSLWTHALRFGSSSAAENNMGWVLFQEGDPQSATDHFMRSLAIRPANSRARVNLATVIAESASEIDKERLRQAVGVLRAGGSSGLPDAHELYALGLGSLLLGDAAQAARDLEQSLAVDPNRLAANMRLGQALQELNEGDRAIEAFQRAVAVNPSAAAPWVSLGGALVNAGRFDEAVDACERAVLLDPDRASIWTSLGYAQWRAGRHDEARTSINRSLAIDPTSRKAKEVRDMIDHAASAPASTRR